MRTTVSTAFLIVAALAQASALAATPPGGDTATALAAPAGAPARQPFELGLTYGAERSELITGQSFWLQGGALDLSVPLGPRLALTLDVSREHASNIAGIGDDLTLLTTMLGPRYVWSAPLPGHRDKRWELFGEALLGVAHGDARYYPPDSQPSTDAFAWQLGGGVEIDLSPHWALRPLEIDWVRTSFRNSTTDVQNSLLVSAGVVFRFPVSSPAPAAASVAPTPPPPAAAPPPAPVQPVPPPVAAPPVKPLPAEIAAHHEIELPGVEFATASARLLPQSTRILDKAADVLAQHPDLTIVVEGFTDSRGSVPYNLVLSQHRAQAVLVYLRARGVTNPMTSKGYGKSQPIADNATPARRQRNRRVVLRIVGGE